MLYALGEKLDPVYKEKHSPGGCVAGVQRGGRREVECERKARRLGSRRERDPNDQASRSHSTSPLPPLCTPVTQARRNNNLSASVTRKIGLPQHSHVQADVLLRKYLS